MPLTKIAQMMQQDLEEALVVKELTSEFYQQGMDPEKFAFILKNSKRISRLVICLFRSKHLQVKND